jgi:hypothetical protein
MALGALIVVAVLAVAAVEGTRFLKARASGDQASQVATSDAKNSSASVPKTDSTAPQQVGTVNPSGPSGSPSLDTSQAAGAVGTGNAATPPAAGSGEPANVVVAPPSLGNPVGQGGGMTSAPKKGSKRNSSLNMVAGGAQNVSSSVGGGQQVGSSPVAGGAGQVGQPAAGNSAANAQEMQEVADQHDKLAARAQAANDSVENLRKQMAAGGNNLRSDISASQARMKMYMQKSEAALNAGDADSAKKYMSLSEREVEKLEAFFGH